MQSAFQQIAYNEKIFLLLVLGIYALISEKIVLILTTERNCDIFLLKRGKIMQSLLLNFFENLSADLGVELLFVVAFVIVGIALVVATLVVAILRIIIFWNYWIARGSVASGATGEQAATETLKAMGIDDVIVKKAGIFRAIFYGNHYNPNKKIVYLRRSTFYGKNVTSVALAVQKTALVLQDRENSGKFKARWRMQKIAIFGPLFFIPIILVGLIVDLALGFTGMPTLASSVIALAYFIISAIFAGLTIPVEKRGTRDAMELLDETDLLSAEEKEKAGKVLKVYVLAYIADFILTILKLIQLIFKIIFKIFSRKK